MPVLNKERRIKRALDLIAGQEDVKFEVIIIYKGYADNSIEIALQYLFIKAILSPAKLSGAKQNVL